MPAHRSEAEAEVREAVVARLREIRPDARIIHEINTGFLSTRIDVLAVSPAEIIAVEIKSEKDKLDRLPAQLSAMKRVSHSSIAAIHEKFLVTQRTNKRAAHWEHEGEYFRGEEPCEADGATHVWVYPQRARSLEKDGWDSQKSWDEPELQLQTALPPEGIHFLWREELMWLCQRCNVPTTKHANMTALTNALWWYAPGGLLTKGICAALRARKCLEADPPLPLPTEAV